MSVRKNLGTASFRNDRDRSRVRRGAGYTTSGGVTEDGRAVNVALTAMPADSATDRHAQAAVETALCR